MKPFKFVRKPVVGIAGAAIVGLAVTSHNDDALTTATFDNTTVSQLRTHTDSVHVDSPPGAFKP